MVITLPLRRLDFAILAWRFLLVPGEESPSFFRTSGRAGGLPKTLISLHV
jgi:hypothetical protein